MEAVATQTRFWHVVLHLVIGTDLLEGMWQIWEPKAMARAKHKLRGWSCEVEETVMACQEAQASDICPLG